MTEMTAKQASEYSGKSVYWLRTRECAWCSQTALNSLRYGCGAIWEKCDPKKKLKKGNIKEASP